MLRFPWQGAHRPITAAVALVGALSTANVQADPYHHHHYHGGGGWGGGWGRPGLSISIGGGGGGFNYYSAGSAVYGPGLSVYSGPAYPGPIIAPPVYVPPYGYGGYGYGYGYPAYGYGYGVTSPYVYPTIPDTIERAPAPSGSFSLPMVDQGFGQGQGQAGRTIGRDPLNIRPNVQTHPKLVKPSTPEAQLRALRLQDMGDQQLRMLRYSNAAQAYEKAIEAAEDIPDPRFRLGVAFVGKGRLVEAAATFEEAAALDPQLPARAPRLDDLLGTENRLSKEQLKETVAQWANQDVRDTRRLFLLGVIMHLDGDVRAREIFEAAAKIGGATPGLQAFLNPPAGDGNLAAPQPGQVPGGAPVLPRGGQPGGVPLPPAPNLGNPTGPLPPAPVPGRATPSTIPSPTLPTPALPQPGLPQPSLPVPDPGGAGVDLPLPVAPAPSGAAPSRSEPMPTPAVTPISGTLPTLPPLSP